ncbi:hypothetical protein [Micromonospora ureilytica]|uniref:hypothetical protein n=1 Tax=Micromonospora ureilytica TaxID=709868 RepID=UPI004039BD90
MVNQRLYPAAGSWPGTRGRAARADRFDGRSPARWIEIVDIAIGMKARPRGLANRSSQPG